MSCSTQWVEIKTPGWADLTIPDQTSRARQVAADPIGNMSVASIGVSDLDRWVARLRKAGVVGGSIRNQHTALRSALQVAVRWQWIATDGQPTCCHAEPRAVGDGRGGAGEVWRYHHVAVYPRRRSTEPRPYRLVVAAISGIGRYRSKVAPPRSPPLVSNRANRPRSLVRRSASSRTQRFQGSWYGHRPISSVCGMG